MDPSSRKGNSRGKGKEKPRAKSADFTEAETNALVSIVYDLFEESDDSELKTGTVNWNAVRDKLNRDFSNNRTSDNVRLRFKTLKATFNLIKELRGRRGWTWDPVHSKIIAPSNEAWKALTESSKEKWRPLKNGKRFPWYDAFALMVGGSVASSGECTKQFVHSYNDGIGSSKMEKPYPFSLLSSVLTTMASSSEAKSAEMETKESLLEPPPLPQPPPVPSPRSEQTSIRNELVKSNEALSPPPGFHLAVTESGCENLDLPPSPPPLPLVSNSMAPDSRDDLLFETGPHGEACQSEVNTDPLVSGTTETGPHGEEEMDEMQIDLNRDEDEISDRSLTEMAPRGSDTREFETILALPGSDAIVPYRSKRNCISGYSRERAKQPRPLQVEPVTLMQYSACGDASSREGVRTIQNAITAVRMLSTRGLKKAGKMLLLNCRATLRDHGQEHRLHRILRDNDLPIDVGNIPSDDEAPAFAPATMQDCEPYCQGMFWGKYKENNARPKSADFTEAETNALVSIVYDLFKESGSSELITGRVNWNAVRDKLNEAFSNNRTADNVRSRFKTLKATFNLFKELRRRNGWTWDPVHSKIVAPNNEAWKALIESKKEKWRPLKNGKRFPWYDAFALMVGGGAATGEETLQFGQSSNEGRGSSKTPSEEGRNFHLNEILRSIPSESAVQPIGTSGGSGSTGSAKRKTRESYAEPSRRGGGGLGKKASHRLQMLDEDREFSRLSASKVDVALEYMKNILDKRTAQQHSSFSAADWKAKLESFDLPHDEYWYMYDLMKDPFYVQQLMDVTDENRESYLRRKMPWYNKNHGNVAPPNHSTNPFVGYMQPFPPAGYQFRPGPPF